MPLVSKIYENGKIILFSQNSREFDNLPLFLETWKVFNQQLGDSSIIKISDNRSSHPEVLWELNQFFKRNHPLPNPFQ